MASDNFLGLVNRVLKPMNEVELTSSDFATAEGVYADARDAINRGLYDVYTYKQLVWPFLYSELTFNTTRGIINYTKPASVKKPDWNSFRLSRVTVGVTSITQTAGVATVTTSATHNFLTGDYIELSGADQDGYNVQNASITVTGTTTFTYSVDAATVSPATGTFLLKSNTLTTAPLEFVDKDEYNKFYAQTVENFTSDSYQSPAFVSRKPSNDYIIFYPPDRVYQVTYWGYTVPERLSAYSDTHLVPEEYENIVVDMALHYMYMFRDNIENAAMAKSRADDGLAKMIRVLSPFANNMVTP